jgi:hypothetical protein
MVRLLEVKTAFGCDPAGAARREGLPIITVKGGGWRVHPSRGRRRAVHGEVKGGGAWCRGRRGMSSSCGRMHDVQNQNKAGPAPDTDGQRSRCAVFG